MQKYKRFLKDSLITVIDCGGSPTVIIMKLSRTQIIKMLERVLPDDTPNTTTTTTTTPPIKAPDVISVPMNTAGDTVTLKFSLMRQEK